MIRKTFIALSAAALLGTGLASTASAKTNLNFDINLGLGGGYVDPYPVYPVADDYYDDDPGCGWVWVKKKVWNAAHTHKIWIKKKTWVCG